MENITELHSALQSMDQVGADILLKDNTEITTLPASFLKKHQILQVLWRRVLSPVMFHVGFAPPESVFVLTGNPEAFIKMCQVDKVSLDSPQQALEYFSVFLEVTRSMDQLSYQVRTVDEIGWRNNLKEPAITKMNAIRDKYKDIIAPKAGMVGYRYLVSSYVMQNTDLIHVQAYMTAVGTMELKSEILEKNLPVDFGA